MDFECKRDEFVRIIRVLDCRICNYEHKPMRIDITPNGLIKPLEAMPKQLEQRQP
jgi:hypothetical protein